MRRAGISNIRNGNVRNVEQSHLTWKERVREDTPENYEKSELDTGEDMRKCVKVRTMIQVY